MDILRRTVCALQGEKLREEDVARLTRVLLRHGYGEVKATAHGAVVQEVTITLRIRTREQLERVLQLLQQTLRSS